MPENSIKSIEHLPVQAAAPLSPINESAVAGETVHARGGLHTEIDVNKLHKGDILANPDSGARLVVEGVRGSGDKKEILFTKEYAPGVHEGKSGNIIRQLPVEKFDIRQKTGEFTEPTWGKESLEAQQEAQQLEEFRRLELVAEFDEIDEACQSLFAAVNEEYREQQKSGSVTAEAEALMDQLGETSSEIVAIGEDWDTLSAATDVEEQAKRHSLLDKLKSKVGQLPQSLVRSNPLLRKIHREYQPRDEEVEGEEVRETRPKKGGKRRVAGEAPEPLRKAEGAKKGLVRNIEDLEVTASGQPVAQDRQPRASARERALDDRLAKYRQSLTWWEGAWPDDESHTLSEWISAVQEVQSELNEVADEIDKLYGRRQWERAMWQLGEGYRKFALKRNGIQIGKRLTEIRNEGYAEKDPELRTELRGYLFSYLQILGAGVRVIDKLRREQRTQGRSSRSGAHSKEGQESRHVQPGTELATVSTFETGLAELLPDAHPKVRGAVAQGLLRIQTTFLESARAAFEKEGISPESLDLGELEEVLRRDVGVAFLRQVIPALLDRAKLPNTLEVAMGISNLLVEGTLPALQTSREDEALRITYDNR